MTAAPIRMTSSAVAGEVAARPRRLRYLIPAVVFVALALMLGWALNHDPRELPSALIDKPVPQFSLAPVKGRALGLSSDDLRRPGDFRDYEGRAHRPQAYRPAHATGP